MIFACPRDAAPGRRVGLGVGNTSELLRRSIETRRTERATVGEILAALGDRAFGIMIVLLVLPTLIPGPPIPGYSFAFAVAIALVASQLARGFDQPVLPGWWLRRSFNRAWLDAVLRRAAPFLKRVERVAHTRPSRWTTRQGERRIGGLVIAVAAALAVPVPLGNTPPGLALLVLGIGLIERDGRLLAAGVLAGFASVLYVTGLTAFAVFAAGWALG